MRNMKRVVQMDAMGIGYAEVSDMVRVISPGGEEVDVSDLDDNDWNKLKNEVRTKKASFAKIKRRNLDLS